MSKISRTLVALMTVQYGTAAEPKTAAPGEEFEAEGTESEINSLIDRGIAGPVKGKNAKPAAASSSDVGIPDGWESLKADDLVDLARRLGAARDVTTKAEALEYVGKVVAERAKPAA